VAEEINRMKKKTKEIKEIRKKMSESLKKFFNIVKIQLWRYPKAMAFPHTIALDIFNAFAEIWNKENSDKFEIFFFSSLEVP